MAYLLLAHGQVLEPPIGHLVLVCAGVPPQAGLAGAVQQVKDDEGGGPEHDAEAAGDDAVQVAGADGAAEGALEAEGEDGDGDEEVCAGDGRQDDGRGQVGVGGPHHGDLALAQLQVAVPPIDAQGVHQHEDDGAAQHDDQQAQT